MHFVLLGAAVGAAVLGVAGFVFGASVPDERAGEAAALVAKIGAGVGALLGGALAQGCTRGCAEPSGCDRRTRSLARPLLYDLAC